jgi:hypothetical protein
LGFARHSWLRYIVISAAITFVIVATCVFLYPAGFGAALRLSFHWFQQLGLPPAGTGLATGLLSPLLALLRYEPAVVFLGLAAAAWAVLRRDRQGIFLTLWAGVLLLIVLLQSETPVNAAALLLPGYLLVGLLAAAVETAAAATTGGRRAMWVAAGGMVALGALVVAAVSRFARIGLLSGENAQLIGIATLAFGLAGLVVIGAMAWDSPHARRGVFLGVALLFLVWQWGAATQLSRLGANDPRERWVITGTDDDVSFMVDLLARVSRQTVNSERDLSIFSLVDSPVLRWYLRDYTGFQVGSTLPFNAQPDVVIAPLDAQLELPNDYFGADFGLQRREMAVVETFQPGAALKWWLFRESDAPLDVERVVVWVRSDLAGQE